ncbi:MAG: acetyltransferase [Candidatus Melainabacteria bacterium]
MPDNNTQSRPWIIVGTGDFAEVMHHYLTHETTSPVAAFSVDSAYNTGGDFAGLPVVNFESLSETHPPGQYQVLVAIGYSKRNKIRQAKFEACRSMGYAMPGYISRHATYYGTPVGENTIIMEDNTIQPCTRIGDNCVLWSGNHIGHHGAIGDHVFISSHVVISGHVTIQNNVFLGVNATLRDGITVGEAAIIGAGAVMMNDAEARQVYPGPVTQAAPLPGERVRL